MHISSSSPNTMSSLTDDPRPVPPIEPALEECCGNGCDPCIFDIHYAAMERYRAELAAWEARHPHNAG